MVLNRWRPFILIDNEYSGIFKICCNKPNKVIRFMKPFSYEVFEVERYKVQDPGVIAYVTEDSIDKLKDDARIVSQMKDVEKVQLYIRRRI